MMKIIDNRNNKLQKLSSIEAGQCFIYNGNFLLLLDKTLSNGFLYNAVYLSSGNLFHSDVDMVVNVVFDAAVIIK